MTMYPCSYALITNSSILLCSSYVYFLQIYFNLYLFPPPPPPKKDCNNQLSFVYEKNSKLKILFLSDW